MWQLWDWDVGGWSASVNLSHNRPRGPAMQTAGDADCLPPRARGPVEAEEEEGGHHIPCDGCWGGDSEVLRRAAPS